MRIQIMQRRQAEDLMQGDFLQTTAPFWALAAAGVIVGAVLDFFNIKILAGALPVLAIGPLYLILDRRLFPSLLFGPLSYTYLFHALGYALGPIWQEYVLEMHDPTIEFAGLIPAQWGGVLGLWTLALVFPLIFMATYRYLSRRIAPQIFPSEETSWAKLTIIFLVLSGFLIAFGFLTGSSRLGSKDTVSIANLSVTAAVPAVQVIVFFFLAYQAARHRGNWFWLWLGSLLCFAAVYFLDGGRGIVAMAALFSASGFVSGGESRRRVLFWLVLFTFGFIPLAGLVLDYRDAFGGSRTYLMGTGFSERTKILTEQLHDFGQESSLARTSRAFFQNTTAHLVDKVFLLTPETIPFAGFEGLEKVPSGLVPKIINPNKPILNDGDQLAVIYAGQDEKMHGSYMPTVGDGFRRFGWPGVVLIYIFAAAIFTPFLAWCWARRQQCQWLAMFLMLTLNASEIFSMTLLKGFYTLLWIFPKYMLFFWLIGLLTRQNYLYLSSSSHRQVYQLKGRKEEF